MWLKIASFILRNRLVILITVSIITVFMLYQASKVTLSYEYASLLPKDDSSFVEYQRFKGLFGEDANIMVVAIEDTTNSFFKLKTFNKFIQLCDTVDSLNGVESLMSVSRAFTLQGTRLTRYFTDTLSDQTVLDSVKNQILTQKLYSNFLFNKSHNVYLVALTINKPILDSPAREKLIADIVTNFDEFTKSHNFKVYYSGLPFIRTQTSLKLRGELSVFILIAALVCAFIVFLFFRSLKLVGFVMLIVAISVIWVIGWMGIFGYHITILNTLLPPLIIVIGVPNCVFLLNKFHQEYKKHGNQIKALQRTIQKTGNATFLTNLTTAAGFGTFVITKSDLLKEFGLVATIGIMEVFVLCLILIPAIFSYLTPPNDKQVQHLENKFMTSVVKGLINIALYKRKVVYIFAVVLLGIGIYGISLMSSTGYMVDDLPQHDPILTNLKFIEKEFNGALPLEIQINTNDKINFIKNKSLNRKVQQLYDSLDVKYPEISKPLSMIDILKFTWQAHNGGDSSYYALPNSMDFGYQNKMKKLVKRQNNSHLQYSLLDSSQTKLRIKCNILDVGTEKMVHLEENLRADLDSIFPAPEYSTNITGSSMVFFKGTNYLISNLYSSLALAILIITGFMAWMFRSKRMVLVSILPNLFPLVITAALMGYFGIPIKPSTILVFSIAFGISVDDTIHYLAKYRQELTHTQWNIGKSVVLALRETGTSMIYTSVILFFGFGIFIGSQFGGTVALGLLVAITLLVAMFSNLILLPSLLLTLEKSITNKSFKEPLLHIYDEEEDIDLDELKIISKKEDED